MARKRDVILQETKVCEKDLDAAHRHLTSAIAAYRTGKMSTFFRALDRSRRPIRDVIEFLDATMSTKPGQRAPNSRRRHTSSTPRQSKTKR